MISPSVSSSGLGDQAVTDRKAADKLRTGGWLPTNAIASTIRGRNAGNTPFAPTSGTAYVAGGMVLPGGRPVSSITVANSGAATTPLNQWFFLADTALNVLATTVDDTTTAWGANAPKTLLLATTIGGGTPGGTYTPTVGIEAYLGFVQVASVITTLRNLAMNSAVGGYAPIMAATSSVGVTTPASLPNPIGALTAISIQFYGWVS